MNTQEVLKRVRAVEIKTRGLSNQIFSGEYSSAFKGRGMAFSEVREYTPGDEIRTIDWNVTARLNHPYVKVFEEERELTVILVVDVSAGTAFGTNHQLKKELITELSALLAFSAIQNNDKIGVLFFAEKAEKFIPPKKGRSHILRIIQELINYKPDTSGTNISGALKYLNNIIKKRAIVFLISDFLDEAFSDALKITNRKHDLVGLHVRDRHEDELPDIGLVPFKDPESSEICWIDTSDREVRTKYSVQRKKQLAELKQLFRLSGVDFAPVFTGEDYVKPLMNLFRKRET